MDVLFKGFNDIEQIVMIIKTLGTPTDDTWPEFKVLPDYHKLIFPDSKGCELSEMFPGHSEETIQLLKRFLVLNPEKRISTTEALSDPYFLNEEGELFFDPSILPLFEKEHQQE